MTEVDVLAEQVASLRVEMVVLRRVAVELASLRMAAISDRDGGAWLRRLIGEAAVDDAPNDLDELARARLATSADAFAAEVIDLLARRRNQARSANLASGAPRTYGAMLTRG